MLLVLMMAAALADTEPGAAPGAPAPAPPPDAAGAPAPDAAAAAPSSAAAESPPPPAGASPIAVLAAFEKAWRAGDIDAVLGCVSSEAVELALGRSGPPGGRFARAQADFLIRDLLHYGETVGFRVVAFEWEDKAPHARAEWTHRMASGETRATLDIVLAPEAGGWRVIRIATR